MPDKDLTGQRFTRLVAQRIVGRKHRRAVWECRCDCGAVIEIRAGDLVSDKQRSCGCLRRERTAEIRTKHGKSRSSEFRIWAHMLDRCHRLTDAGYRNYGARGIVVCDRWRESFASFLADMGPRPSACHSIDRIDNDGNYCPENCRWATRKEQNNNKRQCHYLTHQGRTLTLQQWAEETGIDAPTIRRRLSRGWDAERALTEAPASGRPDSGKIERRFTCAEYRIWVGLNARCRNPRSPAFHRYGGRGITVCERWRSRGRRKSQAQFDAFLADMGRRPSPAHSLDRIDNDGPYSPENCRWATTKQQANNRCTSNSKS